jgi:prepilin-type N-terminal cleavage/methylation domain-containing protein
MLARARHPRRPRTWIARAYARARTLGSAQAGFTMIEVIVSALLMTLLATGLYSGFDGASAASGNNRARTIAAALAQQDQERLRAFQTSDLGNLHTSTTATVAGVAYTVASDADWVSDSSGTLSCTNTSGQADYLEITSTVTWASMGGIAPVKEQSLIAPPSNAFGSNLGNLAVQVTDHAGNPVTGAQVTLGAPANLTLGVNALGCAVFGYTAVGSYPASASLTGYVDPSGASTASAQATVTASATTLTSLSYDQAASIAVSFDTKVGAAAAQAAQALAVTASNSTLAAPGTRIFDPPGSTLQSTINATSLYPFTGAYGIYAGACKSDDPTTYNPNYFSTNPGAVALSPGQAASVTVREPAINIAVTRTVGGAGLSGAHVIVKPLVVGGCVETYAAQLTNATGALPAPGFPFGNYTVCADDGIRKVTPATVANTVPGGTSTVAIVIPTSLGTLGVCT